MHDAYVIETATSVAGVLTREARGFRLFASDPIFAPLEGRAFANPIAAQRAAEKFERRQRAQEIRR